MVIFHSYVAVYQRLMIYEHDDFHDPVSPIIHPGAAQGDRSVRGVHVLVWRGVGRHGSTWELSIRRRELTETYVGK